MDQNLVYNFRRKSGKIRERNFRENETKQEEGTHANQQETLRIPTLHGALRGTVVIMAQTRAFAPALER